MRPYDIGSRARLVQKQSYDDPGSFLTAIGNEPTAELTKNYGYSQISRKAINGSSHLREVGPSLNEEFHTFEPNLNGAGPDDKKELESKRSEVGIFESSRKSHWFNSGGKQAQS